MDHPAIRSVGARAARSAREVAAPVALSLACVLAIAISAPLKTEGTAAYLDPGWDRHLYIAMANGQPLDFHLAPFGWRVLVPLLAWASPFALQPSFLGIAVASATASGVLLSVLLRDFGCGRSVSLAGVLLFYGIGWSTRFQVMDFWIPDATATAFTVAATLAAKRQKAVAFAAILAVGVLAKESVFFAAPLYHSLNARTWLDWRALAATAAATAPALAVLAALRLFIPQQNGDLAYIASLPEIIARFPDLYPPYGYLDQFHRVAYEQRWLGREWDMLRRYTAGAFGVLPLLLAALGAWLRPSLALRLSPFIALCFAQLLFATDTERLVAFAAPAAVILAATGLQRLASQGRVDVRLLAVVPLPALALQLRAGDGYAPPLWLDAAVTLATGGAALLATRVLAHRARREGQPAAVKGSSGT